jgi:hypothetical protein
MDGRVHDQDYNDGAQDDHPIGKLNAAIDVLLLNHSMAILPYSNSGSPKVKRDGKFDAEVVLCLNFLPAMALAVLRLMTSSNLVTGRTS